MIIRLGNLGYREQFTTVLTKRSGVVLQKERNIGAGILVELYDPDEEKSLHENVLVIAERIH